MDLNLEIEIAAAAARAKTQQVTLGDKIGAAAIRGAKGLAEGVAGIADLPYLLPQLAVQGGAKVGEMTGIVEPGTAAKLGQAFSEGNQRLPSQRVGKAIDAVTEAAVGPIPDTALGDFAETTGQFVGAGVPLGGRATTMAVSGLASETAGKATEGTDYEPWARFAGAIVGGVAADKLRVVLANDTARKAFIRDTMSVDDLETAAGKLYAAAEANGAIAGQVQIQRFSSMFDATARKNGLVSPKGRYSKAYPLINSAREMLDDYIGGTMTPTQMQQVRKLLQAAAGSADRNEARIGAQLLKTFDRWTDPMAPQFREANALWSRAAKGKEIEQLIELAGSRAGQFTGSGFENALRTEFRALERRIIKKQSKGWSPDQVAAIKRVARGGSLENLFRGLGKAAPTGIVSVGITGGVPFAIGNAVGGPVLGAIAAGTVMGTGAVSRAAATSMQHRNALLAAAQARAAGTPQASQQENLLRKLFLTGSASIPR